MRARLFCFLLLGTNAVAFAASYRQSVGIGVLQVFNVKLEAHAPAIAEPSLAPRSNRDYLDGFNRVDSSGNIGEGAPGLTSRTGYFGFINNAQVDLARGTLALHLLQPETGSYFSRNARSGLAPEVHYRILREGNAATLGLELRAARIDLERADSRTLSGAVRIVTDTYALGGVVPQPAPYAGSFTVQPGAQRIGDTPTRSLAQATASLQGRREFEVEGWLLRLGAVWEPVRTRSVQLQLHGGPAAMPLEGSANLQERWIAAGLPALDTAVSGERRKWLIGTYAGFTAEVALRGSWHLQAGADYLAAGKLHVPSHGRGATFDFSRSILAELAVAHRF